MQTIWQQYGLPLYEQATHLQSQVTGTLSSIFSGVKTGIGGLIRNMTEQQSHACRSFFTFGITVVLPVMFGLYSVLFLLLIVLFPATLTILFFHPGLLWSLFALVPLWSFSVAKRRYATEFSNIFIESVRSLDDTAGKEVELKIQAHESLRLDWFNSIRDTIAQGSQNSSHYIYAFAMSLIPGVGSLLTASFTTYFVCESLSMQLLEPYTIGVERMNFAQREAFRDVHKWSLFGFALPCMLLLSVPVVGQFFLVFAQAAVADWWVYAGLNRSYAMSKKVLRHLSKGAPS